MEVLSLLLVFFSLVLPFFTDPISASASPASTLPPTSKHSQDQSHPNSLRVLISTHPTSHDGTLSHTLSLNLHLSRSIPSSQLRLVRSLLCFGIGEDIESDSGLDFVGGDDGILVTGVWIDGETVLGLHKDFEIDELELDILDLEHRDPWNASLIADVIRSREKKIRLERVKTKRKRKAKLGKSVGKPNEENENRTESEEIEIVDDDGKQLQFWFLHSDSETGTQTRSHNRRIVIAYPTVKKFPVQKNIRITYERKYATRRLPVSVSETQASVFQVFWAISDVPIALENLNIIFELPEDAMVVDGVQDRRYAPIERDRLDDGEAWTVVRRFFSNQMTRSFVESLWIEKFRFGEKIEVYAFCGICAAATLQMILVVVVLKGPKVLKAVPKILRDWPLDNDEMQDLTMYDVAVLLGSETKTGVLATLLDLLGRHQLVILRSKVFGLLGKVDEWPRLDEGDVRERDRIVVESICGGEMVFDVALVSILDVRLANRRSEKILLEKELIQTQSRARYAWVIAAILPILAAWRFYSMMAGPSNLIVLSFAAVRFGHCTLLLFVAGIVLLLITLSMISRKLTAKGKLLVARLNAYSAHLKEIIRASGVTGTLSPRVVLLDLLGEWKQHDRGEDRNMLKNALYVDALHRRMKGRDVSFEVPDPDEVVQDCDSEDEEDEGECEFDD